MTNLKVFERGVVNSSVKALEGRTFTKIGDHTDSLLGTASIIILDSPPSGYDKGVVLPNYCIDPIVEID